MKVLWGVAYGGVVRRVFDGVAAFQEEGRLREIAQHHDAWAVVSRDGGASWVRVHPRSTLRPDPRQPARPTLRPESRPGVHRWVQQAKRALGFGSRPDGGWAGGTFWRR